MRIYLASTLPALRDLWEAGRIDPATAPMVHTVTPSLREWYAEGDEEELEYLALRDAARTSLRLLAGDPDAPVRRVVLAAEVPDGAVLPWVARPGPAAAVGIAGATPPRSAARLVSAVDRPALAAVHVDDSGAEPALRAAVASLTAADAGDADARFVVEATDDEELLWYATQEVPALLQGRG
jgi:hypothetical protein